MSSNGERLNVNFKISKKILGKKFLPKVYLFYKVKYLIIIVGLGNF